MTISSKDKEQLSYLYETSQYKALVRLCSTVRQDILEKLAVIPLEADTTKNVAFLQGQIFALDSLQKKVKEVHKKSQTES